jgi:hypothetical protein
MSVSSRLVLPLVVIALFALALLAVGKVPLKYNVRNLVVRWPTTLLTAFAFTMVIALLTVMLAFVNGMYHLTAGSGHPGNVIVLADGATDELFSNLAYGDIGDVERSPLVLHDEHGQALSSAETYIVVNQPIPRPPPSPKRYFLLGRGMDAIVVAGLIILALVGGLGVYTLLQKPLTPLRLTGGAAASAVLLVVGMVVSIEAYVDHLNRSAERPVGGRQRRFIQVRGMDDPAMAGRVHGLPLHPGGAWFSPAGVDTVQDGDSQEPVIQAVLGEGIARELGHDRGRPSLQVGDPFEVGPRRWVVTGILQSAGSTFDSEVWAKRQIVGPMFGKVNYSTVILRTASAADAEATAKDLTTNFKKSALQAQTETAYYDKLNGTNQQFLVAIIFVAIVMAVGGVFGVMNTMFAAISQRIKDIGVLRILGFASWQILVSFLLESLVLALVGGLLGCALGYLANGWTASSIVGSGQGGGKSVVLKLVVDGNILATGVLLTLVMGGLGGLLPALSAMRLKPLDSLR